MNNLEYRQMREREDDVIAKLNSKLGRKTDEVLDKNLSNLQKQLKIVSKRLDDLELWVLRDTVEKAIISLGERQIKIPKPEICFTNGKSGHKSFAYVHLDSLIDEIKQQNISYTIKDE